MQDRMMEEVKEDVAHIERTLERHAKRRSSPLDDHAAAERRKVAGNKRYTPPRTR